MAEIKTEHYRAEALKTIENRNVQKALSGFQQRIGKATAESYKQLPEGPGLRMIAHDMRMRAVENLDVLLETFAKNVRKNGGHVWFAENAEQAVAHCLEIAQKHGVRRIVKGKSMLTEEIGLNPALEAHGIEVCETDLGEYIIQLLDEPPFHLLGPALHKTRDEIGALFAEKLGIPYTDDPPTLTLAARTALREKFLTADMGITGCNLACAQTGHVTLVSNEGNVRMSSTLPNVHIAVMGMERIVARPSDHDILFRLLSGGAAAQKMAAYVSYVGGPRQPGQADGPDEVHVVIVDNGRSKILGDKRFREIMCCIRCSACLNVCPVYGKIGGHAYGWAYPGPVGAVLTPLLTDIGRAYDLCHGETLCGACKQACPVNIDIPRMILELRAITAEGDPRWNVYGQGIWENALFGVWAKLIGNRRLYEMFLKAGAVAQKCLPKKNGMIRKMPSVFGGWTRTRDLKPLANERFVRKWNADNDIRR